MPWWNISLYLMPTKNLFSEDKTKKGKGRMQLDTLLLHRDGKVTLSDTVSIPSKMHNCWYLKRKTVVRFQKMLLQTWISLKCIHLPPAWGSTHTDRCTLHEYIAHDNMLTCVYQRSLWICWASNSNLQARGLPQYIEPKIAVPIRATPTPFMAYHKDQWTLMIRDSSSEQSRFSRLNTKKWWLSRL